MYHETTDIRFNCDQDFVLSRIYRVINCRAQTCFRLELNMTHYGERFAFRLSYYLINRYDRCQYK